MSERVKIQLSISKRASEVLKSRASERKRGDFVSAILEAYESPDMSPVDVEALRLQLLGLSATIKCVEGRLEKVEAALVAKTA